MKKVIININMLNLVLQNTSGPLPTSTYAMLDGGIEIGFIQIRHQPSHSCDVPTNFASHIYYEIKPEYRHKGYGKKILKLGLKKVEEIGLKEIIITCYDDNTPSKKIIEANGGILVDSYLIPTDQKKFLKYKLNVK